jgi:hypothetical protein
MAAGRKKTAPKHGATNARPGRTASSSVQAKAKAAPPARPKRPTRKVAQKAVRDRTQARRPESNRTVPQVDAVLAGQLESVAHELGQLRETRAELKDLRRLIEALTGMVEGLVADQRVQGGPSEQDVTSEEHRAPAKDADEPDTADDQRGLEPAESAPSA